MYDSENCSNSHMATELEFKPIILIAWISTKKGRMKKTLLRTEFWHSIEQHMAFLSFKSPSLSLWTTTDSHYCSQLGSTAFPVDSRDVWCQFGSQND